MIFSKLFDGIDFELKNITIDSVADMELTDIIYDSRKVTKGCVFVCLSGYNVDGHKFAGEAVKSGAALIVSQEPLPIGDVPLAIVKDTRLTLAMLSANFFSHPADKLKTIGITGTKGKTTTAAMLKAIMEKSGQKFATIGTLGVVMGEKIYKTNNTTPESYEIQYYMKKMVDEGFDGVIIEVSSIGLKWHRTDGFIFDVGVFTNFATDHIGDNEHKDLEEYRYCKSLLFRQCKIAVVNNDDKNSAKILEGNTCERIYTFGIDTKADFTAKNTALIYNADFLGIHFDLQSIASDELVPVKIPIPGRFNVYNALSAVSAVYPFAVDISAVVDGLSVSFVKGRVETVKTGKKFTLLIDYAHNALSMENLLETLREYSPNRLVCLFGAGGNRAKSRRYEMGEVCGRLADLSVITADNSRFENVLDIIADIQKGMAKTSGKNIVIPDRKEAIRYVLSTGQDRDIIVLAGKGHEDYQEIKGVKYHFDEREVIRDILAELECE